MKGDTVLPRQRSATAHWRALAEDLGFDALWTAHETSHDRT